MTADALSHTERSRQVRRPIDVLLALSTLAGLVVYLWTVHVLPVGSNELSEDLVKATRTVPHWLSVGVSLLTLFASLALVLLIINALLPKEPRGALDAGVAAVVAAGASFFASFAWSSEHGELDHVILHGANGSILIYDCAFVAFLTASDVVRRGRWTRWAFLTTLLLLIADFASRALAPMAVPVALFGGLLFGWAIRWALQTPTTRPNVDDLASALGTPNLTFGYLSEQEGSGGALLEGSLSDGTPVEVRIFDRDTRGSGVARRLWALVRLSPMAAGHPVLSSRSRLERLSLASCLAERNLDLVPRVLSFKELEAETLVLVTTAPQGRHPAEGEAPADIAHLFAALRLLHDAGVAHRDLRPANLVLSGSAAGFATLEEAQPGASDLLRRLDLTQLLTTAARCSSPAVAVKAMRDAYGPTDESALAAVLQPIALAPWGWSEMRSAKACVAEMRQDLIGTNEELPQASLERFRWRTVLTTVALIAAAFLLVGQLSKVNLGEALSHANLGWCAVAIVGSAITYLAAAENLAAFVPKRLPLVRGFGVQLSTAFVGVAMPPTVGHVAVNSRYLHRQGVDDSSIAAAVALSQIVNVITTVVLLLVIGLLTGSGVSRFKIAPSGNVLIALGAFATLVALLALLPKTRALITRNVWPRMRSIWPRLLEAISSPVRLSLGGGANLLLTAAYVLAFVAAIRAVGGHPAILPAAAVFLAGNAVGSTAPTPGGLGAVEAVLAAGLSTIGIPVHEAIPAVLIFRLATFWLPIPFGWIAYVILQRREVL